MTLARYIASRVAFVFGIAFVTVVILIALIDFIEILGRSDGEASLGVRLIMAILHAPSVSMKALPFVMLLSAMWAYITLSRASETVAARAAGSSFWGIARPGMAAAALMGLFAILVYAPLSAAALNRFEAMEAEYFESGSSLFSATREGLWLRESAADGTQTVIRASKTNAEGTELRGATVFLFDRADKLTERVDAAEATLDAGVWTLFDVTIYPIDEADAETPSDPQTLPVMTLGTRLTAEEIQNSFAQPESISIWRLPGLITNMEASGFAARRHKSHLHSMIALPALLGAMTLIAAAFSIRAPRFAKFGRIALGCALTGFAFYFMSDVSLALGASGAVPPPLGAWAPVVGASFAGLALAMYFRDG